MSWVCLLEAFTLINNTIKDSTNLFLRYCQPSLPFFAEAIREVFTALQFTSQYEVKWSWNSWHKLVLIIWNAAVTVRSIRFRHQLSKAQRLDYVAPSLTLNILNSAHTGKFMYGLQNTDYLLYNISSLVFTTETVCVHCAVRVESLNTIQDKSPIEMLKKAPSTSVLIYYSQLIPSTDITQS